MNRIVIAGIAVAIAIVGGALASPLFYDTEVNEELPVPPEGTAKDITLEKFASMDEDSRVILVDTMSDEQKEKIMESAKLPSTVSEEMDEAWTITPKSGQFDGLAGHRAGGDALVLDVGGDAYLRFENFEVTNGPDLRVYVTQGGDVNQGIQLAKLKGSVGSQNYPLGDIDTDVYDTVVIYCQPFGVYFGEAVLT